MQIRHWLHFSMRNLQSDLLKWQSVFLPFSSVRRDCILKLFQQRVLGLAMKNILIALLLLLLAIYVGADFFNHSMNLSFSGDGDSWEWTSSGADLLIAIPVLLIVGAILFFVFSGVAILILAIGLFAVLACLLPALISLAVPVLMVYLLYLLIRKAKSA